MDNISPALFADYITAERIDTVIALSLNVVYALVILIVALAFSGWAKRRIEAISERHPRMDATLFGFLGNIAKYIILAMAAIFILNRFGIQTTSLVALIGAAGLAIGLALQGALSNLAAGVMIILFRPFRVGHFIEAGSSSGTVREISLFFTELKTYDGLQLILPNSDIWSSSIKNYSVNATRLVDLTIGVSYDSDLRTAEKVLKQIKAKVPGVYPYALPLGPEEAQAEFAIWAGGNGGVMFKNGKWVLNSKENVQTMTFLKKLTDQKLTQPNPAKCDRTACAQALFAAGKAAFINGSVFLPGWLKDNGGAAINLGSGSFVAAPGKKPVTLGVQDYFTAYKANGRKAEISKWMDFIFEPTNYAGFLKAAGGFIPATKSAGAIAAKDAKLAPFIKLLPSAIFYPGDQASWPAVKGAIQQQVGTALVNPKKTMDALQAKALAASK